MPKPIEGSYFPYFKKYIALVPENDLLEAFKNQQDIIELFFSTIDEEKSKYAYAPGKWTLKELLQHVIDTERIFNYRSLAFARKEPATLPGFEENDYAANSHANQRSWKSLVEEFKTVRKGTEMLFNSFNNEMLNSSGMANNHPNTVIAMGFTTLGHLYHHKQVIEERYLD